MYPSTSRLRMVTPPLRVWLPDKESIDDDALEILSAQLALFDQLKTPSGALDRAGLRTVMQSVGSEIVPMNWLTDEDIDAAMDAYDTDKDGVISREEFQRMAQDNVFLLRSLQDYRRIFEALDTGGNGSIGPTELYRYFEESKCDDGVGSFERVERLIRKYDLNNDGVINFGEFLRLARYESVLPLEEILRYVKKGGEARADGKAAVVGATGRGSRGAATVDIAKNKVHVLRSPEEFQEILDGIGQETVLVLFASLTWCRPCKKIQPQIEKLAAAYGDACDVVWVKIYGNESDALKTLFKDQLKVRVTPSFFFFQGGKLLESTTGAGVTKHETELRKVLGDRASCVTMMYP
jgi:Ca2+-binding EF-hand superfamily protein